MEGSLEISKKGDETVDYEDLRQRDVVMTLRCESTDHCQVDLAVILVWRVRDTIGDVELFRNFAQQPHVVLKNVLASYLVESIGSRPGTQLPNAIGQIERGAQRRLSMLSADMGVRIYAVRITRLMVRFPTLAEGGAAVIEADRLRTIDPVVRGVSPETTRHVQTSWGSNDTSSKKG